MAAPSAAVPPFLSAARGAPAQRVRHQNRPADAAHDISEPSQRKSSARERLPMLARQGHTAFAPAPVTSATYRRSRESTFAPEPYDIKQKFWARRASFRPRAPPNACEATPSSRLRQRPLGEPISARAHRNAERHRKRVASAQLAEDGITEGNPTGPQPHHATTLGTHLQGCHLPWARARVATVPEALPQAPRPHAVASQCHQPGRWTSKGGPPPQSPRVATPIQHKQPPPSPSRHITFQRETHYNLQF
eukprot:CAMPEP_0184427798 /NCGR_PEP_ID=MMETSP0738-20130409/191686_1 /TAXON_ID=385413 /ORGANISM="Thalassiosira miniscula, Strain CCMP1093" /LENGTH=248 /DNA_ID=CAMNT_0026791489 /DNA_START=13 /DNA_END=761 /DNA_ORIENTATION=+